MARNKNTKTHDSAAESQQPGSSRGEKEAEDITKNDSTKTKEEPTTEESEKPKVIKRGGSASKYAHSMSGVTGDTPATTFTQDKGNAQRPYADTTVKSKDDALSAAGSFKDFMNMDVGEEVDRNSEPTHDDWRGTFQLVMTQYNDLLGYVTVNRNLRIQEIERLVKDYR